MSTAGIASAAETRDEDATWWDEAPWDAGFLDPLDLVTDVSTMMSVLAAERFVRVDAMHQDALRDSTVFRGAQVEIVERSLRLELAAALQITEYAADRLLVTAEALVGRYPGMLALLARAGTTERHADVFVELVDTVEPHLRDGVIPRAVELAETLPVGAFRRRLRTLVDSVRAAALEQRHQDAIATRRVAVEAGFDGMAWLMTYIPAVEAHAAYERATAMAKVLAAADGETRTLDQLRADILADLIIDGTVDAHPDAARGIRARVAVTVPALSLLDDDHAAGSEPAVVEGVGPIPISRARELCANADGWTRILTHPETGIVLSVGREKYKPPAALRKLVQWRADRCMAPGCGTPASRCEIDHRIPWSEGGRTELANLNPFCTGHHTLKHHGGWTIQPVEGDDGAIEWISPLGRRYITRPERRVPVFRVA
ncbi:DUF222 domain-containing protein [Microbacterium sp. RD1]|uniref:HNH endonuclease signature motif containing protein n=1 Tax=Microbacterium sp. RD1 TaxID=3457313 RepID=UPI003FA5EB97